MEASRVVLGLLVAILLPRSLPYVNRSTAGSYAVALLIAAYTLAGALTWWKWLALVVLTAGWVFVATQHSWGRADPAASTSPWLRTKFQVRADLTFITTGARRLYRSAQVRSMALIAVLAILTVLTAALLTDATETRHFLGDTIILDKTSIVLSGFLFAVFICHEPVVRLSGRFSGTPVREYNTIIAVDQPGIYIGWLERALIFAFIASGQSGAAALALAAKSLARYPAIERGEIRGEYFLIGTFMSVFIAALVAVVVRLALGRPPM